MGGIAGVSQVISKIISNREKKAEQSKKGSRLVLPRVNAEAVQEKEQVK